MTYYFISYMWNSRIEGAPYTESEMFTFKWIPGEFLTTMHPIEWLVDIRNDEVEECGNKRIIYEYSLIGWKEVSEEIYIKYKGEVG